MLRELIQYFSVSGDEVLALLMEHIQLTALALLAAIAIGIPLGILISYVKPASKPVLAFANLVQAIPSMALLGLAIPILGIGMKPAVFLVVIYSLLPIIKNTYAGLMNISPQMLEAALPVLEALPQWDVNAIHDAMIALAGELGVKNGTLLWPVRIAAAGTLVTPGGAMEILTLLGREEALRRLRLGLEKLKG